MANKVEAYRRNQDNFQWSFRLILNWMKLVGCPLYICDSGTTIIRFGFATCYSLILFFVYFTVAIFTIVGLILQDNSSSFNVNRSTTLKWNDNINQVNELVCKHGTHLTLMFGSLVKWKEIVAVLNRIEKSKLFSRKIYSQFRKVCCFGLGFAIVVLR